MESKLQYYMRVFKGASFKKFFKVLDNAHERSGKNKIYLFFDMLHCMKRYGAGYNDYVIFEFWNLDAKQRDTYLTRFRSKKLMMFMNDHSYAHIFNNKNEFNKVFKDFIGRECLDLETATDEEIKDAYRKLAKKYHPDQYGDSPLSELAGEKMKEINEAYDTIVSQRKNRGANNNGYGYNNYNTYNAGYNAGYAGGSSASGFNDVRRFIMAGRIADAEQILNGVPVESRNAEWYFLKGTVLYRRGWLEEAKEHFTRACQMDPGNPEYQAALNQAMNQRSGVYGGYNPNMNMNNAGGCNACDICNGLICADCCCECMGGDLIPCC